jgi:hypothetical protein
MSDEPVPSDLPTAPKQQSYDALTSFNDRLRSENSWVGIDLDAALTPQRAQALEDWRSRQRTPWTTADIAMVGLAGVLGTASIWFDAAIDRAVRDRLSAVARTRAVRIWEKAGKRLPMDYMGEGFGGRAHRIKSAGHDLARPFKALRQIMDGEFEGVKWSFGERSTIKRSGQFDVVSSFEEALVRWLMHLGADVLTPMSLPIPGSSLLYELDNETIRKFALHAYSGLRAGEGLNLRSATVAPGMTALTTEVVVRSHVHLKAMRETGTFVLSPQEDRKRTELRLAAHSLVGAVSIGKATAQGLITKHPAAIRHIQVPTLLIAGKAALQAVADASAARRASAPTWDQLVLDVAQPWQLDLASDIDAAWSATSSGLL